MVRKDVRDLIGAFCLISVGGFVLHLRIHPVSESAFHWIPAVFAGVNAFVLPLLFSAPRTVSWAYLFTWVTVVVGTVGMAYHSATTWKLPVTPTNLVFFSTLPDILILWAKVFIAHRILRMHGTTGVPGEGKRGCVP